MKTTPTYDRILIVLAFVLFPIVAYLILTHPGNASHYQGVHSTK